VAEAVGGRLSLKATRRQRRLDDGAISVSGRQVGRLNVRTPTGDVGDHV
jgi:hypothetical protein